MLYLILIEVFFREYSGGVFTQNPFILPHTLNLESFFIFIKKKNTYFNLTPYNILVV